MTIMLLNNDYIDYEPCTSCTEAIIAAVKRQDEGGPTMRDVDYLIRSGAGVIDDDDDRFKQNKCQNANVKKPTEEDTQIAVNLFLDARRRRRHCWSSQKSVTSFKWLDNSVQRKKTFSLTLNPNVCGTF
uniref:Uncharacterized protein n=1 Tax=Ditylum brightwellii TaxID=49249 RepID=A0A7S2EGE6_9STRA|mmetsp:Transcript_28330/g.42116  ORF Transcript_28330/g.42116 Transcript_28330/m.42116 type:complete len:129 (+) Transcript_28330:93-479(+)